jgi:hypothetical protein
MGWKLHRQVTTADWPTTPNSYNPVATVTHRLFSRMLDNAEAAIAPMDGGVEGNYLINSLELRASFSVGGASATFHIFGRRLGDLAVKLAATVVATAGTQVDAAGRYFATTFAVTSYWPKTMIQPTAESGTGIMTVLFDKMGWSDFWVGFTTISSGNVAIEYSGC